MSPKPLSGTWMPVYCPKNSVAIAALLVFCSSITSATRGYDGSMINGLNIIPQYSEYFHLTTALTGLGSAAPWLGGCISPFIFSGYTDKFGRRQGLLFAAFITLFGAILQTAAQNETMFVVARVFLGLGTAASGLSGPVYIAETVPYNWRSWGNGMLNDAYYVGGLIAAGVALACIDWDSNWAWRMPSLVQGVFSLLCILILPFVPESPRWLASKGHLEDAHAVLALTHANGDKNDPVVLAQYKEIIDTLNFEKSAGEAMSAWGIVKSKIPRRRVGIACTVGLMSTSAGNIISSYYLGDMLDNAGITSGVTQLQINCVLNAWALIMSLGGTYLMGKWGRKPTVLACESSLAILMFMIGGLTAAYGTSTNQSGIYATVACVFLFTGAYSIGWTPVLYLYPPELINYSIRSKGIGFFEFCSNATAMLLVFTCPIALDSMGWKFYMLNGSWDIICVAIIAYLWVETKGRSLEEIDAIFDGSKHSNAPDLMTIHGQAIVDVDLSEEVQESKVVPKE